MIPFNHFKAHYASVQDKVNPAIQRVLESGWYILGKEVENFETELAAFLGVPHVVGVASGTEAIALALMALGIGAGDEVITTDMTAYPTITGICQSGATPCVVDICPDTGLLDIDALPDALTPATRAIVPVHLYGQSCDMHRLMKFANAHHLLVVEDCAQAIGATCGKQRCGSFGQAAAFSFYPTKNLGAFGDGGAVALSSATLDQRLRQLRNYGQTDRYTHTVGGINSRLDELQAAVLRAKLPFLESWNARRRELAAFYRAHLVGPTLLREAEGGTPVYHLFPIRVPQREAFMEYLKDQGIQTLIHYPIPVHAQTDFQSRKKGHSFPAASAFASEIVSLPLYPELSDADAAQICRAVNAFFSS